jgi:group II intron reverse transcriptase/maturase
MSFWGATVITSLVTTIPIVGKQIVFWLWGGFSIDHPTLNRFYSLHYTLPFVLAGLSIFHIAALHQYGSTNPLGINTQSSTIHFGIYFFSKDLLALLFFLLVFAVLVFFYPEYLGHPDNLIPANPYSTPQHIVPEWYFCAPPRLLLGCSGAHLDASTSSLALLYLWPMFFCGIIHRTQLSTSYPCYPKGQSGSKGEICSQGWRRTLGRTESYDYYGYDKKLAHYSNGSTDTPWSIHQRLTVNKQEDSSLESVESLEHSPVSNAYHASKGPQDPKVIIGQVIGKEGLPKGGNSYGNRTFVVGYCTNTTGTNKDPYSLSTGPFGPFLKEGSNNRENTLKVITSKGRDLLVQLVKCNKGLDHINHGLIHIISDIGVLVYAYECIKSNPGNMTKGSSKVTLDSIDLEWLIKTSDQIKAGKYKFSPARRVMIPKPGKKEHRPLGVTNPRDKVVQQAILYVLECIFEPRFLDTSHGFRPGKGTHTALKMVDQQFKGAAWVIEGDIKKCFDSVNHDILLRQLRKVIQCDKTIALIRSALNAGYVLDGKRHSQKGVGTPQGSILSPILANIYMHEFDLFMQALKLELDKGVRRRQNPEYSKLLHMRAKAKKAGDLATYAKLRAELRKVSSSDQMDPNFVRIYYVRYADDFVISIIGPHKLADTIKRRIGDFLKDKLALTISEDKTKVTQFSKEPISFLGAEITNRSTRLIKPVSSWKKDGKVILGRITPRVSLHAPIKKIIDRLIVRGFFKYTSHNLLIGTARKSLVNLDHADIIIFYNAIINGLLNYYSFADNRSSLGSITRLLRESCALTLTLKYKLRTQAKAFKRFGKNLACPITKKELRIPSSLSRIRVFRPDTKLDHLTRTLRLNWTNKLTRTNLLQKCIVCGDPNVEMHHVRKIRDLRGTLKLDWFTAQMAAINRKQVPLCRAHHMALHHNRMTAEERLLYLQGLEKMSE